MRLKRFKATVPEASYEPELRVAGEELFWPPGGSAGVIVTEQTALQLSALLATITVIGTDVSVLPLGVVQTSEDGRTREARDHVGHQMMCRTPDGEATPVRWRQSWMAHALLFGNGYAEIRRRGSGQPYSLHLLDPNVTRADRDPETKRLFYRTGMGDTPIPAENVLHISGLGFDGISGYNMVRLLRQAIGLGLAGETFAADFFSNGSEPGGVIEVPGRLKDDEAVNRLRNRWEGRHQGPGRRSRVAVLEEGAKWNPTSSDPEKSQLSETRRFQVIDATRPWRVPPHKIGDLSEAHLANLEASNQDYLMNALMGWLVVIEQECNLKLLSLKEWAAGYRFRHDVSAQLRGNITTRFQSYAGAIRDGWLNRNEVRGREGLNPMPEGAGGDLYTVQMQVVPLSASAEAAQNAAKGKPDPEPDPGDPADGGSDQ